MKPTTVIGSIALGLLVMMLGCDNQQNQGETLFRGAATIACDNEVAALIAPQIAAFVAKHDGASVRLDTTTAFDAMWQLLGGNVRAAIVARDYLPIEDSLLRQYAIEPHKRFLIATDAVVFAISDRVPRDTADESVLRRTLAGERSWLSTYRWAIPAAVSSITAHLTTMAGGKLGLSAEYVGTGDSVIAQLEHRRADVGVLLLSQFLRVKDRASLRTLRIVIRDTATGDRIAVAPHAATIVKERYPFRVPIYGYLLEPARNFAYGVIASIAQEPQSQRAMLQAGIVPAYAKLQLVEQE